MRSRVLMCICVPATIFIIFCHGDAGFAAHPLITDDTGTQGYGKFQVEVNGEYFRDDEDTGGITVRQRGVATTAAISYGFIERADLVIGVPYQWLSIKEDGTETVDEQGVSDVSVEIKWRFLEHGRYHLAVKPGVTFPTGDEDKGLGTGKVTYGAMLIATYARSPWAAHANVGYIRNGNRVGDREDLWHGSLAGERKVTDRVMVVANIGIDTNPDPSSNDHPAFILGGVIYTLLESLDIDAGIKAGLTKTAADGGLLAGIAWKF